MAKWTPINEAASILGIHPRTLRRHVDSGKRASKMENGRRLVLVQDVEIATPKSDIASGNAHGMPQDCHTNDSGSDMTDLLEERDKRTEEIRRHIEELVAEKDAHITRLEAQLQEANEARSRSDMIVMQLTRNAEQSQRMLEDLSRRKTVWQRVREVFVTESV